MNLNNTFKGCCDEDEGECNEDDEDSDDEDSDDEDGNDSLDRMCWGSDSNKPRPPTEKQALHKTALGSMAKILYNISFIINIQSFDMIKFKYSHHDLQYGKQSLHNIALDRISHIDNDHQNQNEPFLSSYVIMIYNIFH